MNSEPHLYLFLLKYMIFGQQKSAKETIFDIFGNARVFH